MNLNPMKTFLLSFTQALVRQPLTFCEAPSCLCLFLTDMSDIWFCLSDVCDKRRGSAQRRFLMDDLIVNVMMCPCANF